MVCRICFPAVFRKNTAVCGYIQCPADMIKILNTWGTAAAFQIFFKGYGEIQKLRADCLRQMQFLPGFFQVFGEDLALLKIRASLIDRDIIITSSYYIVIAFFTFSIGWAMLFKILWIGEHLLPLDGLI